MATFLSYPSYISMKFLFDCFILCLRPLFRYLYMYRLHTYISHIMSTSVIYLCMYPYILSFNDPFA